MPNHVAPDHPWTAEHPDYLLQGSDAELRDDPESFVAIDGRVYANGRDPYFPAWPDVVQVNAFSPTLRSAAIGTLRSIAAQCDGVRCDMAMLVMNDTFEQTWGARAGKRPADDYWPTVITAVRESAPDFLFVGEAYWDLEYALQQQRFDYCYDKRLYDRLLHDAPESVRLHLCADDEYQAHLIRFIENHDEPRVATLVDRAREKALAVATFTQTGARLVHQGQAEGSTVHLPVFLGRFPTEPADDELTAFYSSLWAVLADPTFRHGRWRLCERTGWAGSDDFEHLLAWCWDGESRWLVVVNLSDRTSAAHVRAPWPDLRGHACRLADEMHQTTYERNGDDVCDGLYVELGPWGWHCFRVDIEVNR